MVSTVARAESAPPPTGSTGTTSAAPAADPAAKTPPNIDEVMARAKRMDPTLDFDQVRRLQVGKPKFRFSDFISPQYKDTLDGLQAAVGREDAASIRARCDKLFEIYFLEARAHALCGLALERAGDKEGAAYERYLSQGMIASVLSSGDGKTAKTAYRVYAVSEEYDILFAAGLEKVGQATLEAEGRVFDVLDAKNPETGTTQRIFFSLTDLYKKAEEKFRGMKTPEH